MKIKNLIRSMVLAAIFCVSSPVVIQAEVIMVDPLFEYPVAPEEITTLGEKSNWLIQHFWDNMDFKNQGALNQAAVNDAVKVYSFPMQWADKVEVDKSLDKLLAQLQKNPTLLVQFTKAAEEALYGPRANMWIDEVYLKFLSTAMKNKKISKARKERYSRHIEQLEKTKIGETAPSFDFVTPTGNPGKYEPIGVFTIIEFGDPDCDDCRHAKLKMETNVKFSSLVDRGLVNILFIVPDPEEGWQTKLTGFPSNWVVGASDSISDELDLRSTPSFYVVDKEGKLIAKNVNVDRAISLAMLEDDSAK